MRDGYLLNLRTFHEVRDDKAQALKPLEEAAEVFGAWQLNSDTYVLNECMDVVQAVVNLLAALGFTQEDVDAAIERCNERNRERGRL